MPGLFERLLADQRLDLIRAQLINGVGAGSFVDIAALPLGVLADAAGQFQR